MHHVRAYVQRAGTRLPGIAILICSVLCSPGISIADQKPEARQVVSDKLPWSERMALSEMIRRGGSLEFDRNPKAKWAYETGVFLEGIEKVWRSTRDEKYYGYLKAVVDSFVEADGNIRTYKLDEYNLDSIKSGTLLLSLYRETKEKKYDTAAHLLMKQLETQPRTSEGGFWHKKIYPYQMWLDGIYMGSPFYAQFSQMFNQPRGFEDVANQIVWIESHTRDPKTGLLYHGWDERRAQEWADQKTGCSKSFWGRAMGWYVMGVADVLDFLPETHPRRGTLIGIFQRTLRAVAKYQDDESGLWYQVVDQGKRTGNYLEASASSMFVCALAKGIRKNYLGKEFLPVVQKGYEGIIRRLIKVDPNGVIHLTQICSVGGLGGPSHRNGTFEYYMSEPVVMDDLKGVGAFILASVEMEQLQGKIGDK
jgi:unsaturated rhamnogalacturonyl hydrolase